MDKISRDTIEKCQERFKFYEGMKKYKIINLFFNLVLLSPLVILYGIYEYRYYSDRLEILSIIILLAIICMIGISRKIGYRKYDERIQLAATQYTKTNLENISILEDDNSFKVFQNNLELVKVEKNKVVEIIKIDNVNLVIYNQRMGFLNFIITK